MTIQPNKHDKTAEIVWDQDGMDGSSIEDFVWPDGAMVRGSINLGRRNVIGRKEVDDDWRAISSDLLKRI